MRQKMFSVLNEVSTFLTKCPPLRDNDERLMANIWSKYMGNIEYLNAKDILTMLARGELPSYESISRCRRKLQELHPELRGEKWEKRHKSQTKVKNELKQIRNAQKSLKKASIKRKERKTPHPVGFEYSGARK
tara:strand:+ start:453 stop:851 length:399 start_codon:yes stop_codon:yes gene_type:complete